MIVVADTSPLNYLILIGHIDLLPRLYGSVFIPPAVRDELLHLDSPGAVRHWIANPPSWLVIRLAHSSQPRPANLDDGESEAIALAEELHAEYLAMDERKGRVEAAERGLEVIGTLGILQIGHAQGLLDLREAIGKLSATNFHAGAELLTRILGD